MRRSDILPLSLVDMLLAEIEAATHGSNVVDARRWWDKDSSPPWLDMGLAHRIQAAPRPSSITMSAPEPDEITKALLRAFVGR